jgi:cell division protein FtsI/penicillin-binding protein 2
MHAQGLDPDSARFQEINPLEMIDQVFYKGKNLFVGYGPDGTPLGRHYRGGRLPRSISSSNGKLDVLKAIEVSSNPYFSILAGDILKSPKDLVDTAREFSYGTLTGIDLPGEIMGNLPNDLEENRTGVYSLAIGQHTLVVTPLQTALMLSALANGGKILKPKIVSLEAGEELAEVQKKLFLPEKIRKILLEGMCRVTSKTFQSSLGSFRRLYKEYPEAIKDYQEMLSCLPGKTSTAESVEMIDLDKNQGSNLYTHVWFGGIAYGEEVFYKDKENFVFYDAEGAPELVVVVYLRYGGYGKEAAPIAAQVAKKWKEINLSQR